MSGAAQASQSPAYRAIIWTMLDAGFPRKVANDWAEGWACRPDPQTVVRQAIEFDDHGGFTTESAIQWHQAGFYMPEAGWWRNAGYSPAQANEVLALLSHDTDADEWLASGLPPERVIAYLRAGVSAHETHTFESSEDLTPDTLSFMAALLGG